MGIDMEKYMFSLIVISLNVCMKVESTSSNNLLKELASELEDSPSMEAYSVEGGHGFLPCDISPPLKEDFPILVIFSRRSEPIYSVDARDGNLKNAIHWSSPEMKSKRLSFVVNSSPFGLDFPRVTPDDAGEYHCRVDFLNSPTRNLKVTLHVAVPPTHIIVTQENGTPISHTAGPMPLGGTLTLMCRVTGGHPRPKVTWWLDGELIDHTIEDFEGSLTTNSITLPNLQRKLLNSKLTCQASNSELGESLKKTVILDMFFPPLDAHIKGLEKALMEGLVYQITCSSSGSRPESNITWWKNGRQLDDTASRTYTSANNSVSTLTITPLRSDNGSNVACRAENSHLPGTAVEDNQRIIVQYTPKLKIRPGKSIDIENIKEGEDVYLECHSEANPPVKNIAWLLNGKTLKHEPSRNILITPRTVIFQKIRISSSGDYACKGSNKLGSAVSDTIFIDVKFSPKCDDGQKTVYGGTTNEVINITCSVTANPVPDVFYWIFNTTSEVVNLYSSYSQTHPGHSVLQYTPVSHLNFGSILCIAENSVGRQPVPCVYQVVPASPPESVRNCSLWQNTSEGGVLYISCLPGWNGGLTQSFTLQIKYESGGALILETEEKDNPVFAVSNLPPGSELVLVVYAKNSQGWSSSVELSHFTPIDIAEKRLSAGTVDLVTNQENSFRPKKLGIIIGIIVSVAVVSLLVFIVVIRVRRSRRVPRVSHVNTSIESSLDGKVSGSDTRDPDLIQMSSDQSEYSVDGVFKDLNKRKKLTEKFQSKPLRTQMTSEILTPSLESESLLSCPKAFCSNSRTRRVEDQSVDSTKCDSLVKVAENHIKDQPNISLADQKSNKAPGSTTNLSKNLEESSESKNSELNPLLAKSFNFQNVLRVSNDEAKKKIERDKISQQHTFFLSRFSD